MSEAREEAERRWPQGWGNAIGDGTWRDGAINGFVLGSEWARAEWEAEQDTLPQCGYCGNNLRGLPGCPTHRAGQGETEWEYGSEGAEGTEDPDPRPLADDNAYWPESLEGVREPNAEQAAQIVAKWNEGVPGSARLIRRRKAGPWLPVPGSTVRESDSGVRDPDSEESEDEK